LLKLRVNWGVFFQYLENKAQEIISTVEVDGSNIREVYNEIVNNYFKLVPFIPNPEMAKKSRTFGFLYYLLSKL